MSDELDAYRLPFPHVLRIEPASQCSLACSHCPTGTVDMVRGIMKPETIERVMSQLEKYRDRIRVVVLYHGGEPFLNKHFVSMLRRVKQAGVGHVKTDSNGMLLTDDVIEGIVRERLDLIIFSTDGDSPAMSDFVRRKSDYTTVVSNVKRLLDYKRKVGADKPAVTVGNCRFIDPASYRGERPEPSAHLLEEFKAYEGEVSIIAQWGMRWPHLPVNEDIFDLYHDPYDKKGDLDACDHVVSTMSVRANGDVVACCYDLTSQLTLGNVLRDDLADIWNGERYLRLRQEIATRVYNPTCGNCNTVRRRMLIVPKPEVKARLR